MHVTEDVLMVVQPRQSVTGSKESSYENLLNGGRQGTIHRSH